MGAYSDCDCKTCEDNKNSPVAPTQGVSRYFLSEYLLCLPAPSLRGGAGYHLSESFPRKIPGPHCKPGAAREGGFALIPDRALSALYFLTCYSICHNNIYSLKCGNTVEEIEK